MIWRLISYRAVKELLDRVWLDIRLLAFTCRCGIASRGPWLHSPSNGFLRFLGSFWFLFGGCDEMKYLASDISLVPVTQAQVHVIYL
jgi:hypothetical protein